MFTLINLVPSAFIRSVPMTIGSFLVPYSPNCQLCSYSKEMDVRKCTVIIFTVEVYKSFGFKYEGLDNCRGNETTVSGNLVTKRVGNKNVYGVYGFRNYI